VRIVVGALSLAVAIGLYCFAATRPGVNEALIPPHIAATSARGRETGKLASPLSLDGVIVPDLLG
jgi:hypothetical protein